MAFPQQVLDDITRGYEYYSALNEGFIADLKKGCSDCTPKQGLCLMGFLISLKYNASIGDYNDESQSLYVQMMEIIGGTIDSLKLDQTITFPTLPTGKQVGDADFSPGATASSGLSVSYVSSNTAVATIVDGLIHVVGLGSSVITANQSGDATYNSAPPVARTLTIANNATINFGFTNVNPDGDVESVSLPSSLVISSGSDYTINFTVSANLQYLVHREPVGEPIKTEWMNQIDYNFGVIPDSKYRAYVESGGFRYYYTRVLFPFYSGIYTIQFNAS